MTLLALATSVLMVQELVLSFLPIQLTTVLLMIYTSVFGLRKTMLMMTIHVIIDNILLGSIGMFNIVIPMWLAWALIIIIFNFVSKRSSNLVIYMIVAYFFGHLYGLMFVPFQALLLNIDIIDYLLIDLLWEVVMGITNVILVIWIYEPMNRYLSKLYQRYMNV